MHRVPQTQQTLLMKVMEYYLTKVHDFNFTGHKTRDSFFHLNILDSILPCLEGLFSLKEGDKVADIGTGGGFPGVPLAILYPETDFTLIDSVEKKLTLIDEVCEKFSIHNVRTVHGRFEEIGQNKKYRELFDVVTAKAVAKWSTLLEYALPLLKVGGVFYAYTTRELFETREKEIEHLLGGKIDKPLNYILPEELGERLIVPIKKVSSTPASYPRKVGLPKKHPLSA